MKTILILLISLIMHPIFSDKQAEFYYTSLHDYNILSGVTGSGKSFTSNLRFYKEFCEAPYRSKMILSGNTLESLYDNVISELLEFDKGINWLSFKHIANSPRLINNKTGTMAVCVGANTEKAQDRVQGKSVSLWYADEVVKQPKSFIEMSLSRCRKIVNGKMVMAPIIWTCNPDTPSHYIKKDYIDNKEVDVNNMYFGFYDNPTIDDDYIKKVKKRFTGVFYERMIEGRWTLAEGVVYDKFNRVEHVKNNAWFESKRNTIREWCIGIDWGYSKMLSLLLYGFDHDGVAYGFDEICVGQQLINEELKQMMTDQEWFDVEIEYAVADSEAPDDIVAFEELTKIETIPAYKPSKVELIQEVQKRYLLKDNGLYGVYYNGDKMPVTVTQKENYRWNPKKLDKDAVIKKDDHTQDAEQYLFYHRRDTTDFSSLPPVTYEKRNG